MTEKLPGAFLENMKTQLGAEYQDFLQSMEAPPVISLRLHPEKQGARFEAAEEIAWNPHGLFLKERPRFIRDPYIHAGGYYVQESSSMLIGQYLNNLPENPVILDLCAAPGGKSTLMQAIAGKEGFLVSNEIVRSRAAILDENLIRWGYPNTLVTHNRPADFQGLKNRFDLILVDAPCSGEGMFRKDPDVIAHWSPKMVEHCARRQKEILSNIIPALKPGGRLIYSTCTYNPHENEAIVQWLLNKDPGLFEPLEMPAPASTWGLVPGNSTDYDSRLSQTWHAYPHRFRGEGFFIACLEKQRQEGWSTRPAKPRRKGKARNQPSAPTGPAMKKADQEKWLTETLATPKQFRPHLEGEHLYALPAENAKTMLEIANALKPIRMGIPIGQAKGKKTIPDHALALSLEHSHEIPAVELDFKTAIRYLCREELKMELPSFKGWGIVKWQGLPLGWIKALDKRVNNHLPQHYRIRADLSDIYKD